MSKKTKMIPVMMVRPNNEFIYAPSRILPEVEVDLMDFSTKDIKVSFDKDGVSNPKSVTGHSKGASAWFIKK